jgi:hypothetical protein
VPHIVGKRIKNFGEGFDRQAVIAKNGSDVNALANLGF